jgi:CBS domain containing-hemolysin-like protein
MKTEAEIFCVSLFFFVWFLAAWEALNQLSRGQARKIQSDNRTLADRIEEWIENRHEYSIVFRVLTFGFFAISVSFALVFYMNYQEKTTPDSSTIAGATVATFVLVILAEAIAKIASHTCDFFLLKTTMPIAKLLRYSFFYPIVACVEGMQKRIALLRSRSSRDDSGGKSSTEDEIMSWVEQENDVNGASPLEEDEKRMIRGIFDLDDTPVREIMTPRVDVKGLNVETTTIEEAKRAFVDSGHSRIPVYSETIDEIKGVLFAKDFLDEQRIGDRKLIEIAHRPLFIPETKLVRDLMNEFRKSGTHFAVVIDEYGGTAGIITFEDIIEEIVGDVRDEYDDEEDVEPEPETLVDGSVVVDARTLIYDVNELLENADLPEDEDVDTIGGLVCGQFGRIPEIGETVMLNERVQATVLKADSKRILSLQLSRIGKSS